MKSPIRKIATWICSELERGVKNNNTSGRFCRNMGKPVFPEKVILENNDVIHWIHNATKTINPNKRGLRKLEREVKRRSGKEVYCYSSPKLHEELEFYLQP